jgi:hypothetical protein
VVVTGPEDLVPDQLTERLRARGALPFGRVTAVHAGERLTTILSTIVPLRLEYSPDAPREAPPRLLLKGTRSGLDAGLRSVGEREVAFYSQAAPLMPGGPFPRCYDAEYSSGRFHLLLEDLSETHMVLTEWPLPPNVEACERIVDTWAIFHAFWWRHPRLGREVGTFLDAAALAKIAAEYRERYERFAATLGDRLWSGARALPVSSPTASPATVSIVCGKTIDSQSSGTWRYRCGSSHTGSTRASGGLICIASSPLSRTSAAPHSSHSDETGLLAQGALGVTVFKRVDCVDAT